MESGLLTDAGQIAQNGGCFDCHHICGAATIGGKEVKLFEGNLPTSQTADCSVGGSVLQLLTPFLHIVAPFTLFLIFNYPYGTMSYATGTLFIMYIELYGTSNSVITLYMVKPYRAYLKSKGSAFIKRITFGKFGNEPEHVMVMATESTINTSMY
uniref:G protein-coupled receptor n=1 Tax=Bursaphelenchus xylophilus TaxID=6326 RepID=A0A1I7SIH1_BURXY